MPYRSIPSVFLALLAGWILCTAASAFAANGIDTASGVSNLPFSIEGVPVMNMTATGLGIGIGTAAPQGTLEINGAAEIGGGLGTVTAPLTITGSNNNYVLDIENPSNRSWYGQVSGQSFNILTNDSSTPVMALQATSYGGNVGFGTASPAGIIDSETGATPIWAAMFNYGGGTYTGAYGIWAYGTQIGVFGRTTESQGVYGYASDSGNGVFGQSVNGWAGNFQGAYGVYGQSSGSGWAGEFNSTTSPNGVWIGNNGNNAQLCLNGTCVTSLSSPTVNAVMLGSYGPHVQVGPYAFCALGAIGNPGGTDQGLYICGGSPGAYYWCTAAQSPVQTASLVCF